MTEMCNHFDDHFYFQRVSPKNDSKKKKNLAQVVQPHFTYIYLLSPFKVFLLFPTFLRSRTRRTRFSPLTSVFSKYLPLVSKGGWLPPFHALSSATH